MRAERPSGVVTLLFSDIEGSTRLLQQTGSQYGDLLAIQRRLLREVWRAHGGVEVDAQGDAFLVAFSDPHAAIRSASAAHRRLESNDWGTTAALRVRIAVHTGTPESGDEGYWGRDVHYGARLGAAGHGGQTLVSSTTAALASGVELESLGELSFKDFPAPMEVFHLVDGHHADEFPPPRSVRRRGHGLPVTAGSFIGREEELEALVRLLRGPHPIVTITGPGGSGKSRLAVEAARVLAAEYDDVWHVPIEGVTSTAELGATVARRLGLVDVDNPGERLRAFLADRSCLLMLDNFEQVLEAAPFVGTLARASPGLRVLVTSQAPLRLRDEHVLRLGSLALPDDTSTSRLDEVAAVRLLLDRTAAFGTRLEVTADSAGGIAALVHRLEGLPLAIELAAGRLAIATPDRLVRDLDHRLDALGSGARDLPARQRGLRAMLEWTCRLLEPGHRTALVALAIFADDVDPDVLAQVVPEAYDGLAALADVSLATRTPSGRVALRPPVRRYAALIAEPGQIASLHRDAVAALADRARPFERRWMVTGGEGHRALNPEQKNILGALEWARSHDGDLHADLAAATGWWMSHLRNGNVGRGHVDFALRHATDPVLRARLLQARGVLALDHSDPWPSLDAATAWSALGDVDGEVVSLVYGANLMVHRGSDPERAVEISAHALELAALHRKDDRNLSSLVRSQHAQTLWRAGRRHEATDMIELAHADCDEDPWRKFFVTTLSADFALDAKRPGDALPLYGQCITLCRSFGALVWELVQAASAAQALLDLDRTDEGTLAWAVTSLVWQELGRPLGGYLGPPIDALRARLHPSRVKSAQEEAAELGVEGGLDWLAEAAQRPA